MPLASAVCKVARDESFLVTHTNTQTHKHTNKYTHKSSKLKVANHFDSLTHTLGVTHAHTNIHMPTHAHI